MPSDTHSPSTYIYSDSDQHQRARPLNDVEAIKQYVREFAHFICIPHECMRRLCLSFEIGALTYYYFFLLNKNLVGALHFPLGSTAGGAAPG
jgi:hypothetical protein